MGKIEEDLRALQWRFLNRSTKQLFKVHIPVDRNCEYKEYKLQLDILVY